MTEVTNKIPTTIEELEKLSRWEVVAMYRGGKFRESSEEIRNAAWLIVDEAKSSL